MFCRQLAETGQKAVYGLHNTHISRHRFDDDCGQLRSVTLDCLLHRVNIIIGQAKRQLGQGLRNAGRTGDSQGGHPRSGFDQK